MSAGTPRNGGGSTYTAVLSGATGALTKNGAGTLILAGANNYGGTTTVKVALVLTVVGAGISIGPFGSVASLSMLTV